MKVLVTAGPTREYIDSVRFITNASSGRMGMAIAGTAAKAGCDVTLLLGPIADNFCPIKNVKTLRFTTVDELQKLLGDHFADCDCLIMAAAVGDFTVTNKSDIKIRRSHGPVTLELTPTPDLLADLAKQRRPNQLLIGFAVADVDPDAVAREKLLGKKLDYVVVNTPAAMAAEDSNAAIISKEGFTLPWAIRPKQGLAKEIVHLFV